MMSDRAGLSALLPLCLMLGLGFSTPVAAQAHPVSTPMSAQSSGPAAPEPTAADSRNVNVSAGSATPANPISLIRPWPTAEMLIPAPESAAGLGLPPAPERRVLLQKPEGKSLPITVSVEPSRSSRAEPDETTANNQAALPGDSYAGLPTRERIFQFLDDKDLEARILKELKKNQTPEEFRESQFDVIPPLTPPGTKYLPKTASYPPLKLGIEPGYVVHRRLYFEELNSERFGWNAGVMQPVISSLYFYRDVLLWPARLASNPHEHYDTNLGKCLPGSPVPYYLYPLQIDIYGALFGAGFYTGMGIIFP
jgi:hypothetical protein